MVKHNISALFSFLVLSLSPLQQFGRIAKMLCCTIQNYYLLRVSHVCWLLESIKI